MDSHQVGREQKFEFRGSAGEWFGIWLVNLLLTILTVGIYSAWAKVRTKKYFYQNTYVAGRNFDYHATGMQILIGRIIVVAGFIAFSILGAIPIVGLVLILGLIPLFPFLLVRSMRFNAKMSSWSNVRFGFNGGYGGAFLVYVVYPVLTALTLYTTLPFLDRAAKRYSVNNHTLGKHKFAFDAPIGPFYKAFLFAILWVVAVTVVIGFMVAPSLAALDPMLGNPDPEAVAGLVVAFYVWVFLAFFPAATVYGAFVRNVTFQNASLEGGHSFTSDVIPLSLVWIAISNAVVVIFSLGLMLPWAQIRMARYLATHTGFVAGGSLDEFVTDLEQKAGAIGDAYTDLEGIDIGLPV